jgi:type II secretory pathway component GspD/PulD (secretin)
MRRLLLSLLFVAPALLAQGVLEVISLRHRTAEQVIPVLRPLLEPGGTMSGQYNQLIVRTGPDNLAQIRAVLESIDRPLRRLVVSVRFDNTQQSARSARDEQVDQRIQTLEGGQAYISSGQSRTYAQAGTGFAVMPRISGNNVTLDIAAQQEAFTRGGAVQGGRAVSTVSGRLGEWLELGGSSRDGVTVGERRIWVKVEEAGN